MTTPRTAVDLEPLQDSEYERIQQRLAIHWQLCFRLLWETGIRISEALGLLKTDLLDGDMIRITRLKKRRGATADVLPVPPDLHAAIKGYSRWLRTQRVFPFTRDAAHKALVLAATQAGVRIAADGKSSVHPHLYRHGLGRRAARMLTGLSAYDQETLIARILGHAGTKYVGRYTRPGTPEMQDALRRVQKGTE